MPTTDLTLIPPQERVLVAVSGGADSMALLLMLRQAGRDIIVAHVNHGLRGAESDTDEAFVVAHCQKLNVPVVTERVAVLRRSDHNHAPEAAARDARYQCLSSLARLHHCSRVATGHTVTDLLETVIINWLRGAAVTGLRGIEPQRALDGEILLVRPLLDMTRDATRAACVEAGWEWREDSSNQSHDYLRNRVRHELLPMLHDMMPGHDSERLARQTARASQVFRADLDFLDEAARAQLAAITLRDAARDETKLLVLDGLRFRALHVALQRRVLRVAAQRLQGDVCDLGFERVEVVRRHVINNGRRAVWQWRRKLHVEWTGPMAGNRIRLWLV